MSRFPIIAALTLGLLPALAQGPGEEDERGDSPAEYVIGVEDVLKIVTWGEADLTLTAKVRPDGRITLPLVNDIVVAGMTPDRVRQTITSHLSAFVNDPDVTVIVEEINSFRVYFLGEIAAQGPLQFYRPTRLLQGIATAGGLTDFAKKDITVVREEHGMEKRIEIDYKKLVAGDPGQENLFLKPGDTVLVK
jgi:polysaccharide export outer membrane protein